MSFGYISDCKHHTNTSPSFRDLLPSVGSYGDIEPPDCHGCQYSLFKATEWFCCLSLMKKNKRIWDVEDIQYEEVTSREHF